MSPAAAALSIAAAAAAAVCAAAEGASLPKPVRGASVGQGASERSHDHRSLTIARRFAQLVAAAAAAAAFGLGDRGFAVLVLGVLGIALLVAAATEVLPRRTAVTPGRMASALATVLGVVRGLMSPVLALASRLERALLTRFPAPMPDAAARAMSQLRFREVVSSGMDVGRREQALLHGVFSLGDTCVNDVMVPRVDVIGIGHDTPWSEVLDRVRSSEHARFPVYAETVDDITGILYAKDLLPAVIGDDEPLEGWLSLVRPAQFIPGTKPLGDQLRDFKSSHAHMAIVVDEYGGTAGLITIEDVLEEIVGDINDEYDIEEPEVEQEGHDRFWVSARVTLDELSRLLQQSFEGEDVATVGGLIYQRLGRVPRAGEQLTIGGFRVVVERVVRRRVRRVYFERLTSADSRH